MNKPKLGDILLEANLIDEVQMRVALEEQKRKGTKFGSTLLTLGFIDENVLTAFLSKQLDMPCVSLSNIEIPSWILSKIPPDMAKRLEVVPVRLDGDQLHIAMSDPMDVDVLEEVENVSGCVPVPMVAPQSCLREAIKKFYSESGVSRDSLQKTVVSVFPELVRELNDLDVFAPYFARIEARLELIQERLKSIEEALKHSSK